MTDDLITAIDAPVWKRWNTDLRIARTVEWLRTCGIPCDARDYEAIALTRVSRKYSIDDEFIIRYGAEGWWVMRFVKEQYEPEFPGGVEARIRVLGSEARTVVVRRMLGGPKLTYRELLDIATALTDVTAVDQGAVLDALGRMAISPVAERRRIAQRHDLWETVPDAIRVESVLMGGLR